MYLYIWQVCGPTWLRPYHVDPLVMSLGQACWATRLGKISIKTDSFLHCLFLWMGIAWSTMHAYIDVEPEVAWLVRPLGPPTFACGLSIAPLCHIVPTM
jgi:hypothetical protein